MPVCEFKSVSFGYSGVDVVSDATFKLEAGEFAALLGGNGAGKSTVLRLACGALSPGTGEVLLNGQNALGLTPKRLARLASMMPAAAPENLQFTVAQFARLGRSPRLGAFGTLSKDDEAAVDEALEMLGLSRFRERKLAELSAGELQKALLAARAAQNAPLMLLDEPASHLDAANSEAIMKALKGLADDKGVAVLCVTHDLLSAAANFDRIILMKNGRILADDEPASALTKLNIQKIFGSEAEIVFGVDCVSYKIPRTKR